MKTGFRDERNPVMFFRKDQTSRMPAAICSLL